MADIMRLSIQHRTSYSYDSPVSYGLQQLRLTPHDRDAQKVISWDVQVEGGKKELQFEDQHRNIVTLVSFSGEGHQIAIHCSGEVETIDTAGVVGKHTGDTPLWYFLQATDLTRAGNLTRKLTRGLTTDIEDPITRMHALSTRVLENIEYKIGQTDTQTTAEDALTAGQGVCQDHAHVFIAACRSMNIPARYISGYLMMDDRIHQEASHAWAEAHIDGVGWIGFDVSNGISPDERYVRLATGLDYREAAPIHGVRIGDEGSEKLDVDIQVQQQ